MAFVQEEFVVAGRPCRLVLPKKAARGRPWIWRTEFFGHFPQADIALLERGFHLGYMEVSNMFGAPPALDLMDEFHACMTKERKLAKKTRAHRPESGRSLCLELGCPPSRMGRRSLSRCTGMRLQELAGRARQVSGKSRRMGTFEKDLRIRERCRGFCLSAKPHRTTSHRSPLPGFPS
jgi:hypothetical protein